MIVQYMDGKHHGVMEGIQVVRDFLSGGIPVTTSVRLKYCGVDTRLVSSSWILSVKSESTSSGVDMLTWASSCAFGSRTQDFTTES